MSVSNNAAKTDDERRDALINEFIYLAPLLTTRQLAGVVYRLRRRKEELEYLDRKSKGHYDKCMCGHARWQHTPACQVTDLSDGMARYCCDGFTQDPNEPVLC